MNHGYDKGAGNIWLITTIVLSVTTIIASGFLVWALLNYFDQKNNVDSKIDTAVAEARKIQAEADAADFQEKEKQPSRQFVGPDDYGRLTFDYPKTWSVYVENDATDGDAFVAYLNPVFVPPLDNDTTQVALRVTIETRDYDEAIDDYQSMVEDGSLKSRTINADGQGGTRFDGALDDDIRGSVVLFKIRDKTVKLQTDAPVFDKDFTQIISTITFNK